MNSIDFMSMEEQTHENKTFLTIIILKTRLKSTIGIKRYTFSTYVINAPCHKSPLYGKKVEVK